MTNRILLRLNFAKKIALAVAGIAALAVPIAVGVMNAPLIRAQSAAAAAPKFEASSIRPCSDEPGLMRGHGYSSSAGRLNTGCMPLVDSANLGLIQRAYVRFADGQPHYWPGIVPITGGPAWIHSELYDIDARAEGNPNEGMMQGPMLQALLEDRFQLKTHRETREVPVYALTVAQSGSKLKPFTEGSCTPMPLTVPKPALAPGQEYCKVRIGMRPAVDAQGSTLAEFSQLLDLVLDRPVIDKTGITGKFDIHLEFAADAATPRFLPGGDSARLAGAASDPAGASIFTAIQELGLKLEPTTGPREFLVIDHVERPTEN